MTVRDDLIALGLPVVTAEIVVTEDGNRLDATFERPLTEPELQTLETYKSPGRLTKANLLRRREAAVPFLAPLDGLDIRNLTAGQTLRLVGVLAFLAGICDENGILHAQIDVTQ